MQCKLLVIAGFWGLASCLNIYADDNVWSTNGPEGARIMTIAIHPDDNQRMLIGTVEAGIYKTTNGGADWSHIQSDVLNRTLRDIAYFPGVPDTVYAATVNGLYRSNDAAETWIRVNVPISEVNDVEIHPIHRNLIFAVGTWSSWRSTDYGANWDSLNIPFVAVHAIRTDPLRPDTMYLITHSADTGWTVFQSLNLGLDWRVIHNNLDFHMAAMDLQIDSVNSDIIYVAGWNWDNVTGVCIEKTTNAGSYWFDVTPDSMTEPFVHSLAISPSDHNTIYACTNSDGVLKSTDGGGSWSRINQGLFGRQTRMIAIDPITSFMYLGTYYDGMYKSANGGESWRQISSGIFNSNCIDMALNPRDPDTVYVAAENGHFRTIDGGSTWNRIGPAPPFQPFKPNSVEIDPYDPNFIVMTFYRTIPFDRSRLFRSHDGGSTWECLEFPITPFIHIAISNSGVDRRLFVGAPGIYYSDDDGTNWLPCPGGLPANVNYGVFVSPADYQRIYAVGGGNPNPLYRSTARGMSWTQITSPPGSSLITGIYPDPVSSSTLYVCRYQSGVFKSTDSGDSWENITNDLPVWPTFFYPSGLAVNPANPENLLVYSYGYGMYISDNGGQSWRAFGDGMAPYCAGGKTAFSPSDTSRIYFASFEASVWSIHRTLTGVEEDEQSLPKEVALAAYPNPFNAMAKISYSLPQESAVRLAIYNVLGEQVTILKDGHQAAGEHSVAWDAAPQPSGIYLVRLQASGITKTILMTLLK